MSDTHDAILDILESVFGPEARGFSDADGPGTIEAWDSVTHLNLILAIEATFGIQFRTEEIPDLVTVGMIRNRVEQTL